MKKGFICLSMILVFAMFVVGCGNNAGSNSGNNAEKNAASTANNGETADEETSSSNGEKAPTDVVLYGDIKEFPSFVPMLAKLKEDFAGIYNIKMIPVDWGNLPKVVKTGIASGQPADIYTYWPNELQSMIDSKMILDLTPYLEENNGEWKNEFTSMLQTGDYDGHYYGVPISGVFPLMYANKKLLDEAGVTIPENWNWEQFLAILQQIKEKTTAYPFGVADENAIVLPREGVQSLGLQANKLEELAKLETPISDPLFTTMLENVNELNKRDYWYPGPGALTIKRDEAQSAFYQGKMAILAEASSLAANITTNSDFEVIALPIPTMGDKLAYTGSADGFMIPSNAANKEAAVAILKKLTSKEYMQIHGDAGFLTGNKNVEYTNPIVPQISALYDYAITSPSGFTYSDRKIDDYFRTQLLAKLFLKDADYAEIISDIEALRQEALSKK